MKKRSKRVLAAVLCLVMGLTACGGGGLKCGYIFQGIRKR